MALQKDSVWLLSISACSCAAIGIAVYGLGSGTLTVPLLTSGLMALGGGLLLTQMRDYLARGDAEDVEADRRQVYHRIERVEQQNRNWQRGQDSLSQQVASLQNEALSGTATLARALEDIRQSHVTLSQQIEAVMNRPVIHQPVFVQQAPAPATQPESIYAPAEPEMPEPDLRLETEEEPAPVAEEVVEPSVDDTPFGSQLSLSLEPIVDLFSSQTAHYRLVATMMDANGQDVPPEMFAHHVAQLGQRALLDAFTIRETLGILEQLRHRDPNLCVLVSVGAATLADRTHLRTILNDIERAPLAAGGLVLDINHGVLASLPDASLEGLAILARKGVTLALSQVSISGVDLAALNKLNVRYICLAAASLAMLARTPSTVSGFIQAARALRIQTVITHVTDPQLLAEIMRSARLACGPAFAAPRRLKRAAPEPAANAYPAAA
jgi:EAL domain-containing protein (putative c-di-GMP-specific phosphodiesterase class I)